MPRKSSVIKTSLLFALLLAGGNLLLAGAQNNTSEQKTSASDKFQKSEDKKANRFVPSEKYTPGKPSPDSTAGKALLSQNKCSVCHSIEGKGGCLGPPLDGIGAHRSKDFILNRITNNAAAIHAFHKEYGEELLQHPRIVGSEAKLVTAYLLTLPQPQDGFLIGTHGDAKQTKEAGKAPSKDEKANAESVSFGKKLFYDHGCISCHSINGLGGQFAPPLSGISSRRDRDFISSRITRAEFLNEKEPGEYQERGTVMPPTNLSGKDIKAITDFLMSLPNK